MGEQADREPAAFASEALAARVAEASGGSLAIEAVARIESLRADGCGASALTGLDAATGLTHLSLAKNGIRDIAPLAALRGLEELHLEDNEIASIEPLAGLAGLRRLSVQFNPFEDFGPIARLAQLEELSLGGSWENEDVGEHTLEAFGPAWGPTLRELGVLAGLANLQRLEIPMHGVRDLGPLRKLEALRSLYMNGVSSEPFRSLEPLGNLESLRRLAFGRTQLSGFAPLSKLEELERLELCACECDYAALAREARLPAGCEIIINARRSESVLAALAPLVETGVRVRFTVS
ncbi:MAG: leucine-rich repeat domain-containing protein [Deltaproteobacteria bacterium]|nr:leucine-rich repeat domain-containing protein [Deltaproteobacteria bacterium]